MPSSSPGEWTASFWPESGPLAPSRAGDLLRSAKALRRGLPPATPVRLSEHAICTGLVCRVLGTTGVSFLSPQCPVATCQSVQLLSLFHYPALGLRAWRCIVGEAPKGSKLGT